MKAFGTSKSIVLCVILAVMVLASSYFYNKATPETESGAKTVIIEVLPKEGVSETFVYKTDEEYLGAVLMAEELIEGEMSQYGLFIKIVNGVTADESKQQWWCITKAGEDVFTGADTTPISDGDTFELTLKTGY